PRARRFRSRNRQPTSPLPRQRFDPAAVERAGAGRRSRAAQLRAVIGGIVPVTLRIPVMTVAAAAVRPLPRTLPRRPRWVIARHVARSSLLWAVVWGVVFGLFVFSTIQAFIKGYPTQAERIQLAHSMQAFSILIGQGHHLETVAGFTSWRLMTTSAIIG